MGLSIGIDTGGTFTDLVAFDSVTGRVAALKTSSTPQSPGEAIVNALAEGEIEGSGVESFTHGTTVGTNALIERSGCKVAFLTTKGFEDTPYIQRINRKTSSTTSSGASRSPSWQPAPLPRHRRADRLERSRDAGRGRGRGRELAGRSVTRAPRRRRSACSSPTSTPSTRSRWCGSSREELDGFPLSVSHEVAPIWREYERASTTIADAYLKPLFSATSGAWTPRSAGRA